MAAPNSFELPTVTLIRSDILNSTSQSGIETIPSLLFFCAGVLRLYILDSGSLPFAAKIVLSGTASPLAGHFYDMVLRNVLRNLT